MVDSPPFEVLIVGGGAAALEAAFRLRRIAAGRIDTTVLTPGDRLSTRAMAVLIPFAAGHVPDERLAELVPKADAKLARGRMASVDPAAHHVFTEAGEALRYDALLIAIGGVLREPYRYGLAFGAPGSEERMHGLVQDLEKGYVRRIGFVVPPGASWPVPLYELALMAVERAYDQCQTCTVVLVTYEDAPLSLFGAEASRVVTRKLEKAGVELHTGVRASVPRPGLIALDSGDDARAVDRVVTLPTVRGPAVDGLPHDPQGFLRVDCHGRVEGAPDVYAAGDVTDHPIKQGGLACQQADAAAETIAAQAGVAITPEPYVARLEGLLLTGHAAAIMRRDHDAGAAERLSYDASSWAPLKLAGEELVKHLAGSSHARRPALRAAR